MKSDALLDERFNRMREIAILALDQDFVSEDQMQAWLLEQAGGDESLALGAGKLMALAIVTGMFADVLGMTFDDAEEA